jgi:hypothetical protein
MPTDLLTREGILDYLWPQLLVLALCHSGNFDVGEVLYSIPGVGVAVLTEKNSRPSFNPFYETEDFYEIPEQDWNPFQEFLRLISKSVDAVAASRSIETLWEVARQYLRGRLMEDAIDPHGWSDDRDDVVLRYVIALEKLLLLPGEKEKAYLMKERATCLVSRYANEEDLVRKLLRRAYDERNEIVHRQLQKDNDLINRKELRDVCRRAIAGALIVAEKNGEESDFDDFLRELTIANDPAKRARRERAQSLARSTAIEIGSKTSCLWIEDNTTA